MFQSYSISARPEQGPPRLAALRAAMKEEKLDAFIIPRADTHQSEYVAACDERLAWLTGFTGSAGFAVVTADEAAVFTDGRYRLQVRDQVAPDFATVDWPGTKPGPWLSERLPAGGAIGFDPWLHTVKEIGDLGKSLDDGLVLKPCDNLVDRVWHDRPPPPDAPAWSHPVEFAGETSGDKRRRLAGSLAADGHRAAVLTAPDGIVWLLNIRGADVPRIPVVLAFAILHDDTRVSLFADPAKFQALGPDPDIAIAPKAGFEAALTRLDGPVRVDKARAAEAVRLALEEAGVEIAWADDPTLLPKAIKTPAELAGARAANQRDAVAVTRFLAWLDGAAPSGRVTEIAAAKRLEEFRRDSNLLRDISFDTISGAGPHGAIVHYRVTEATDRALRPGEIYLVDSGGQYEDGTTDITRTVAVETAPPDAIRPFTRVLQGMIAISRARFPKGLSGRDLDALARAALWRDGLDYDHGTGHGVGSYLSVHEGPQRLSRLGTVALEPGMILSNEPGYYREGAFGIRIENLVTVIEAPKLGDGRDQLAFETLTWVPIDRRLIDRNLLSPGEREWLDAYHLNVRSRLEGQLDPETRRWLERATAPL